MTDSNGFVASVNEDGTAGVWIEAEDCHAPCDHEGERCHHCGASTSGILVRVENQANANVGDRVRIRLQPGAVLINLTTIVGIPLGGVCLGLLVLAWIGLDFSRNPGIGATVLAIGLLLGIVASVWMYRRYSAHHQPYISRILHSAPRVHAAAPSVDPVCRRPVDPATARGSIGYQGEMYYFAHHECLQAFLKDPVRYV